MGEIVLIEWGRYQSLFQLAVALNIGIPIFKDFIMPSVEIRQRDFDRSCQDWCDKREAVSEFLNSKDFQNGNQRLEHIRMMLSFWDSEFIRVVEKFAETKNEVSKSVSAVHFDAAIAALFSFIILIYSSFSEDILIESWSDGIISNLEAVRVANKYFLFSLTVMVYIPVARAFNSWCVGSLRLDLVRRRLRKKLSGIDKIASEVCDLLKCS